MEAFPAIQHHIFGMLSLKLVGAMGYQSLIRSVDKLNAYKLGLTRMCSHFCFCRFMQNWHKLWLVCLVWGLHNFRLLDMQRHKVGSRVTCKRCSTWYLPIYIFFVCFNIKCMKRKTQCGVPVCL